MRTASIIITLLLVLSIFAILPISAAPTEVWVNASGPDDGSTHFDTIQEGIDAVEAGGTVNVAAGTYTLSATISITKDLLLLGAGEATTFIDGNNLVMCISTQNLTSSTTIDGFTIQNGSSATNGGGMYNSSSSLTISNCTFSNNEAAQNGGGMRNDSCSPTITSCTFSNNEAAHYGGGMMNFNHSSPDITDCAFEYNTAAHGGGMYNYFYSSPSLTNCTFSNNSATTDFGGGMYNDYISHPAISNCSFSDNSAAEDGGGMYNEEFCIPNLTSCTFSGNTAEYDGGGMYNDESHPVVTNGTFSDNTATRNGGGMYNALSSATVTNCTFSGNTANGTAYGGGGMMNDISSVNIDNCTFSSNMAVNGGGMYNYSTDSYVGPEYYPTITDSTFSGNTAEYDGGGMYNNGSCPTVTGCTFSANTVTYEYGSGGGMYNYYTDSDGSYFPTVTGCTFSGNTAYYGAGMMNEYSCPNVSGCTFSGNTATNDGYGGGMYNYYSDYYVEGNYFQTVTGCTFSGNTAYYGAGMMNEYCCPKVDKCTFDNNSGTYGGGIYNYYTDYENYIYDNYIQTVTNCTFSGNTAYGGAGMMNEYSSAIITNCTFAANSGTEVGAYGGGICYYYSDYYADGNLLTNCILWGNSPDEIYMHNTSPFDVSYCNIQGGYTGTGNIDEDPLFSNDLSLMPGSPCIDAGTDTSAAEYGSVTDDILETARPQGDAYEMGAYECTVELKDNNWSGPVVMKPLVSVMLTKANAIWQCLQNQLPAEISEDMQGILDGVQYHMANAAELSNPVYANGELNMAMGLMKQLNDELSSECYPE